MDNVHPIEWERVEQRGRRLRVFFTSGVEPCSVLDHVQVDYRPREIVVTLFEGSDPKARDQACIAMAESKATDVKLTEAVRGRRVVDGAKADRPEPRPGSGVQGNMTGIR
jgi:hypothetical protein